MTNTCYAVKMFWASKNNRMVRKTGFIEKGVKKGLTITSRVSRASFLLGSGNSASDSIQGPVGNQAPENQHATQKLPKACKEVF